MVATRERVYLVLRAGWWHYRRRVPTDLASFADQTEWVRSLDTRDPAIARSRAARVDALVEAMVQELRSLRAMGTAEELIERLCRGYFRSGVKRDREFRAEWVAPTNRGYPPEVELADHLSF